MSVTGSRTQRFLAAFSAAVHDLSLERRGYRLYHFFDSDVLGRMIFGFRDSLNHKLIVDSKSRDADNPAGQMLLMGALLGQGIGTPTNLRALPPHLYEVRRQVSRTWSSDSRESFELTIALLEIEELATAALGALRDDEPDPLLARFLEYGPQMFYGVELLSGAWESRLARVLRLGIAEPSPFDTPPDISQGPTFDALVRAVGAVHDNPPRRSGISGVRDAMALATLARHVARGADAEPPFHVARFYTETKRIQDAWDHKDVRELLTYSVREHGLAHLDLGEHGVLRTSEYYLIRALFPELGYPGESAGPDAPADADDNVSRIYEITSDLVKATKELRRGGVAEAELPEFRIKKTTLGEFMDEVTGLSSYEKAGTAWRKLMESVPKGLPEELRRQLREVLEREDARSEELEHSLQLQVENLDRRTRDVAYFTQSYVRVHDILTRWRGALRPNYGSLSDHVGLRRWGFSPQDIDETALGHLLDSYQEWKGEYEPAEAFSWRTRFVIELTHRMQDVGSAPIDSSERLGDTCALLSFLWLIDDYVSLARCCRDLLGGIELRLSRRARDTTRSPEEDARWERVGGAVENLAAVAEGSGFADDIRDWAHDAAAEDVVMKTRDVVVQLGSSDRPFQTSDEARAITQGYILFRVWMSFNRVIATSMTGESARIRHPALARESLELGISALEGCDASAPMYVLLLNHCVYVATVAGLPLAELSQLVRQLIGHRLAEGPVWSYRLDDTLGCHYYARAAATVAKTTNPAYHLRSARSDLREAKRWLDRVPNEVDDPEVDAHRALLRELEVELDPNVG